MTVIVKVNPVQIGPFQGSQKPGLGWRSTKKLYGGVREMKLGKRLY